MDEKKEHRIVEDYRDRDTGERVMVCSCGVRFEELNSRMVVMLMDKHLEEANAQ